MNTRQRGFSAIEILIILLVIALLGLGGWYVWMKNNDDKPASSSSSQEASEDADGAEAEEAADPTADWVAYSNAEGNYSFRHPASWVQADSPELCSPGLALFAPTADTVGRCATESGGQMQFYGVDGDESANYSFDEAYYTATTEEAVTVNGVAGTKYTATVMGMEAEVMVGGYPDGTTLVRYVFVTGGKTYTATYVQQPGYPDVLSDFNLLVTETFEFSA